jgi:hypothetical protein
MNTPTFLCSVEVFKTNFLYRVLVRIACGVVRTSELVWRALHTSHSFTTNKKSLIDSAA